MPDERPSIVSTPQARTAPSRRSTSSLGSSLPMPSRRTPNSSSASQSGGPLGSYRNLARSGSTPLRSGRTTEPASLGKRSFSSTGMLDPPVYGTPRTTPKRPIVSQASPSGESYELVMLRTEYEKRIEEEQRAYKLLESQFRSQSRELEALKCQRVEVLHEWEAERAAQRAKEDAWTQSKREADEQITTLRGESLKLQDTNNTLQSQLNEVQKSSHAQVSQLQMELVDARSEAEQVRAQSEHWKQTIERLQVQLEELETSAPQTKPAPVSDEETDVLKEQLSQHIRAVEDLEATRTRLSTENARLSAACERTEILRETNRSLEGKLKRMEALQDDVLQKDEQLRTIQIQQEQWHHLFDKGIPTDEHAAFVAAANTEADVPQINVPSPLTHETLPPYVSTLRGTIMGLSARIEGLTHSVEQLRTSNVSLERQARQRSESESHLASELSQKANALLRAQRQNDVQSDELQRYKELLASFETESQNSHSFDQVHLQRIADLEKRLQTAHEERLSLITRAEEAEQMAAQATQRAELAAAAEPAQATHTDYKALNDARVALEALQSRYNELEAQAQALGAENDQLYTRVGRGEFDPSREKCLVLQDNPVSRDYAIRTSTLEALRKENAGLLEQVEALHEQLKTSGGTAPASDTDSVVPIQTVENLKHELVQLQTTIQMKDKGMLRLKQVFTAKANEFREAVQSLFGYKIRFLENGKVKLTSAYARGARVTTLVFSSEEGNVGEMKLQGEANEGLANVAHLRDYWLSDGIRHSVPCFLAALNLELYENTTQAIRGAFGADADEE